MVFFFGTKMKHIVSSIKTLQNFIIRLSNVPIFRTPSLIKDRNAFRVLHKKHLWIEKDYNHQYVGYYCPMTQQWKYLVFNTDVECNNFLELEIINYALAYDRKELMLRYLHHLCTRQSLEDDVNTIVVESAKK